VYASRNYFLNSCTNPYITDRAPYGCEIGSPVLNNKDKLKFFIVNCYNEPKPQMYQSAHKTKEHNVDTYYSK